MADKVVHSSRIGIVVIAFRSNNVLPQCLEALNSGLQDISEAAVAGAKVVIVNNDPGSELRIPHDPKWDQKIIEMDQNVGFAPAVNRALVELKDVDYILLLNPDTALEPSALARMIEAAITRRAAIVGPLLVDEKGDPHGFSERPFHSVRRELARQFLGLGIFARPYGRKAIRSGNARCLTGACLLVEQSFLTSIGGLDTAIRMYLEDVVLCWRAHQQRRLVILEPLARCRHSLGGSSDGDNFDTSVGLYLTALSARVEFVRRRTGSPAALVMRIILTVGACVRLLKRDPVYRRRQRAVIWWAVKSGEPPAWVGGPVVDLPVYV